MRIKISEIDKNANESGMVLILKLFLIYIFNAIHLLMFN